MEAIRDVSSRPSVAQRHLCHCAANKRSRMDWRLGKTSTEEMVSAGTIWDTYKQVTDVCHRDEKDRHR